MIDKYHADGEGHYNQFGYIQDTVSTNTVKVRSLGSVGFYAFIIFLSAMLAVVAYSL
jgi:hypothetical protein